VQESAVLNNLEISGNYGEDPSKDFFLHFSSPAATERNMEDTPRRKLQKNTTEFYYIEFSEKHTQARETFPQSFLLYRSVNTSRRQRAAE